MCLLPCDRFCLLPLFARRTQAAQPDAGPPPHQQPERGSSGGGMQEDGRPIRPPRDAQADPEKKPNHGASEHKLFHPVNGRSSSLAMRLPIAVGPRNTGLLPA